VRLVSVREDELFRFFLFVFFESAEELAEEEEGRRFLEDDVFLFSSVSDFVLDEVVFLDSFSSVDEEEEEDSSALVVSFFWEVLGRSSLEVERIDDDDFFNFVDIMVVYKQSLSLLL